MAAPEIAVGYVSIVPEVSGFQQQLRDQIIGPSDRAGGQAGQRMGSRLGDALKAGAAVAGVAAGAVLAKGLADAFAQNSATKKLGASLGATQKDAEKYGKVAGKLYTQGVVDNFQTGADTIRAVVSAGLVPPNATNKQLESIATKMADVASTFGTDMGMQTQAVSAMMKNGLAPSASQALDVITTGLQKLGPNADDLLETFQEYSVQFRKLGLDSSTTLGLFQQGLKGGARDTDILADALKEFSIRAVDMSDTSREAYKSLGLSASTMEAQIGKGGESAQKGLQTVLDKLRAMKDPVEREAAAVGLFGTQAEDLGAALFALDPSKANTAFQDVAGSAKKLGDTVRSGPLYEVQSFKRELEQSLVGFMGTSVIPAIESLAKTFITVKDNAAGAWQWVKDIAPYLAPFAILIGGITIALNAQAIATGLATGVFSAYRAAILLGTAVTNGFAAAQALLNAVMALNPITLIVIALIALGAALYVAWTKSETFRDIVMGAWEAIKTGIMWAWENVLKPVVDWLVIGFKAIGDAAMWLWENGIKPAWDLISAGIDLYWNYWLKPIFTAIRIYFKLLAFAAMWVWENGIKPAWDFISAAVLWLWDSVIKPYFGYIKSAFNAIINVAKWLWEKAIKPVFGWVKDKAIWLWENGIKPAFSKVKEIVQNIADKFKWFWNEAIKPVFNWIKDKAVWLWEKGVKPSFDNLKRGVEKVGESFKKAKDFIKEQWNKLQEIAKKPVRFMINTIYNGGIVPLWNKVARAIGEKELKPLNIKGFSTGGILPGYTPGRDVHLAALSGGEAVMRPEFTRGVGAGFINSMNQIAKRQGVAGVQRAMGLPGYANGGIIGNIKSIVSKPWDWAKDSVKKVLEGGFSKLLNGFPAKGGLGSLLRAVPRFLLKRITDFGVRKEQTQGVGGPGVKNALRWARTQAGKPYQWGGAGNPSWDCSGFMSGIQKAILGQNPKGRLWSTFSFQGNNAPKGWVRGLKSPFMVGITNRGVGHTAGTLAGVNVESRGGDGVVVGSRARGYASSLFQTQYGFAPARKYDSGGWLQPGPTLTVNKTGRPEPVLTDSQWSDIAALARAGATGLQPGDRLVLSAGGTEFEAYVDSRADNRIRRNITEPSRRGRTF